MSRAIMEFHIYRVIRSVFSNAFFVNKVHCQPNPCHQNTVSSRMSKHMPSVHMARIYTCRDDFGTTNLFSIYILEYAFCQKCRKRNFKTQLEHRCSRNTNITILAYFLHISPFNACILRFCQYMNDYFD